ncbi:MAG: type II secretion system F family protein [Thermoplasmatales archaeon]|nr:type II secretion system F family protein [Thermoplasmatales archaeon]
MPKEDQELVYALWAMEVLVSSGVGLESAIQHVAEGGYGSVSREFKKVLKESYGGLEKSLDMLTHETKSESLKKTFVTISRSLKGETELADSLRTLANRETEKRKARIQRYIEKLTMVSDIFLIVAILVPIIIAIIPLVGPLASGGMPQIEEEKITISSEIIMIVRVILLITVLGMGMIMFWTKNLEANV